MLKSYTMHLDLLISYWNLAFFIAYFEASSEDAQV
jgi:hypothetical protein